MIYNYSKLRGRMVEICGTQREFSKSLGISNSTISAKFNNKSKWDQDEIKKVAALLDIDDEQIGDYFFCV